MSQPDNGTNGEAGIKTLAIRLKSDTHAQLSLIAQLRGSTITDEIRNAIDTHIVSAKAAPELAGQADAVLEDIERDAEAKRAAIATLFGTEQSEPPSPVVTTRNRGRKSEGQVS